MLCRGSLAVHKVTWKVTCKKILKLLRFTISNVLYVYLYWKYIWEKVFKNGPSKIWEVNCFSRPYLFKFFKGCLTQILLGPFSNTLSHFSVSFFSRFRGSTNKALSKQTSDTKVLQHVSNDMTFTDLIIRLVEPNLLCVKYFKFTKTYLNLSIYL